MIATFGLITIALAWIYQLIKVAGGSIHIHPSFVGMYAVGVILLAGDGFAAGATESALLNVLSLAAALGVLALVIRARRNQPRQ